MRWLLTGCMLLSLSAQAEVYRYIDDNGITVLSRQGVPPHIVGKGYEVLNDQGRVIRTIAPPPTPEELRRREEARARAAADKRLRELYSNVKDLDVARENKLRTLEAFVTVISGNLELTEQQILDMESKAAQMERSGRKIDDRTREQLEQLYADRKRLGAELQRRRELREQINQEFDADRTRLVELYPPAQEKSWR